MTTNLAIEVKGISQSFKKKLALENVSFIAKEGEMLALVGASGSGKSTLLRNLNGLQIADAGIVKIFDSDLQREGKRKNVGW